MSLRAEAYLDDAAGAHADDGGQDETDVPHKVAHAPEHDAKRNERDEVDKEVAQTLYVAPFFQVHLIR